MKKRIALLMMAAALAVSATACGSGGNTSDGGDKKGEAKTSEVANKDKPLVWFNRQPSNSSTGELLSLIHIWQFIHRLESLCTQAISK